jgi:hypothetical protein
MGILQQTKLDLRGVGCFLAIAFGAAWLLELPMWLDGWGLNSPWAALIGAAMFVRPVFRHLSRHPLDQPNARDTQDYRVATGRQSKPLVALRRWCVCGGVAAHGQLGAALSCVTASRTAMVPRHSMGAVGSLLLRRGAPAAGRVGSGQRSSAVRTVNVRSLSGNSGDRP